MKSPMGAGNSRKSDTRYTLRNGAIIDTIIGKAKIRPTDSVLDISAGSGCITLKLLQKAKKVIAFENDRKLNKEIISKANAQPGLRNKLVIIEEDFLAYELPRFDVCISNIPFDMSLPAVLKLISYDFRCAYILVQKEFGTRLTARPGSADYSRLSVIIQLLAHVEHVVRVSRSNFIPVPNVDSCFMKIEPRVPRPPIDVKEFDNLLKYCFGRKNKTLASNLKSSLLLSKIESNPELNTVSACDVIDKILECIGLSEVRTSKMDVEDFLSLLLEFKKININFN